MHAPTLQEVIEPYLHYPPVIQNALLRVETHPTFRVLTKGTLRVLKALVTRATATNGAIPIWARLDRVADEVGMHYKTVQRAMRTFSKIGWVRAVTDGRSEWGVYESKEYQLSEALCVLVELPTANTKISQGAEMSDGPNIDLNLKRDLREISQEKQAANPIDLPPAVKEIPAETGLLPSGVCKLMGIARQFGHKLEHAYAIARPYLKQHGTSPGRSYRYLLAMLTTPKQVDYATRAEQILRAAPDPHEEMQDIARSSRYKRYRHISKPMHVQFFDGRAEVTIGNDRQEYFGPQLLGLYRGIAAGNLIEIVQ